MLIIEELHAMGAKLRDTLLVVMDKLSDHPANGDLAAGASLTICGVTNRSIVATVLRRFPIQIQLSFSTVDELAQIVELFARQTGTDCRPEAARLLAGVSFTPGRARVLFIEARNRSVALGRPLDAELVLAVFDAMGIDHNSGLDEVQLAALRYLCEVRHASRHSIRTVLGIDDDGAFQDLEDRLIRLGYISVTSRGREPTQRAAELMERCDRAR
jgi:Holliday junction resolvasome RuvABC ATP-dependent DNA helicase subunit